MIDSLRIRMTYFLLEDNPMLCVSTDTRLAWKSRDEKGKQEWPPAEKDQQPRKSPLWAGLASILGGRGCGAEISKMCPCSRLGGPHESGAEPWKLGHSWARFTGMVGRGQFVAVFRAEREQDQTPEAWRSNFEADWRLQWGSGRKLGAQNQRGHRDTGQKTIFEFMDTVPNPYITTHPP